MSEKEGGILKSLSSGVSSLIGNAADAGAVVSEAALNRAVNTLMSTMKYAAKKIRESDEEVPPGTKLVVSASAIVVELSLEVPVTEILNEPGQDNECPDSPEGNQDGQDESRGPDEVV
jgi:hypothetical protein